MAAFVWGEGGAQLTPAQIAERRKVAQALMAAGGDTSPIKSPWQGAARVAQAMLGGFDSYKADEAEKSNLTAERQLLNEMLSGGSAGQGSPAAAPVAAAGTSPVSAAQPMGALPSMSSRVYGQEEFNPLDAAVATQPELAAGVPAPQQFASLIGKAAVDNDLPPQLLAAQLKQESGFNPRAVSPVGAAGISQFMPGTAREMGVSDPFNPEQAIPAGARYLRQNIDKFGGSIPQGLAAYNAGPGRVERAGGDISRLPAETQGYVANITGAAGQPPATQQVAQAMPQGINPRLVAAMSSPYVSDGTKKILGVMLERQLAGNKVQMQDLGDRVGVFDSRGNPIRYERKGEPNKGPEMRVIGKDEFDRDIYGEYDPRKPEGQRVTPYSPQRPTQAQPSVIPPAPPGVDPAVWRKSHSERATSEAMPADPKVASSLRNEIQGLPSYKNIAQAAPVYKSMVDAAGRDNRAADVNLIYGMAKIMDPGSVVRESEMTVAQAIATLPQQLQAAVKSQITGDGRLTPEIRTAIMQEARSRILAYQGMFDQDAGMYRGIATRGRINESDVLPTFGPFDEYKPAAPPAAATAPVVIDGYKIKAR